MLASIPVDRAISGMLHPIVSAGMMAACSLLFVWAVKGEPFEDLEGQNRRFLDDEDEP